MAGKNEIWDFNMKMYKQFRIDLLNLIPEESKNQIIQQRTSLSKLQGRRILESLQTFEALLDELERQLLVNPRTGDIIYLINILSTFCPSSMNVQMLVMEFQSKVRTENQANSTTPGGGTLHQRPEPPQSLSFNSQGARSKESLPLGAQGPSASQKPLPLGPRGAASYQPSLSQGSQGAASNQPSLSQGSREAASYQPSLSLGSQGAASYQPFLSQSRGAGTQTSSYNPSWNSPRSRTSQAITIPSSTRTRRISTPTTPTTPTMSTWSNSSTSPSLQQRRLPRVIPSHVIDLIASRFDLMGGRDWQVFVEGLGINLSEYERVRLLTGEVERSEREFLSLRDRLQFLFQLFQTKLTRAGLDTDITEIIVDTLRSTAVWGEPVFNALARQVTEALK